MFLMNYIILSLILFSPMFGKTPIEYSFSFASGYDDNVMRFSNQEFKKAANNLNIMGGVKSFDSFTSRFGVNAKKTIWELGKREVYFKSNLNWNDYYHNKNKKYWSGGLGLTYKWGSYKNIRYSIKHLDDFYLRHYIDRDVSNSKVSPCLFSDQNQKISITYLIQKVYWANFSVGILQRYYNKPFKEFDLDIIYFKTKISRKIRKIGSISFQIENGFATSQSHLVQFRPSSFNRSYDMMEWYLPLIIKPKSRFLKEFGFSIKQENRKYIAEELNDPLHSGRDHLDTKYDFWFKKKINETITATLSNRFRIRETNSKYDWVGDLKSFNQFQIWLKIEWELVYDQY